MSTPPLSGNIPSVQASGSGLQSSASAQSGRFQIGNASKRLFSFLSKKQTDHRSDDTALDMLPSDLLLDIMFYLSSTSKINAESEEIFKGSLCPKRGFRSNYGAIESRIKEMGVIPKDLVRLSRTCRSFRSLVQEHAQRPERKMYEERIWHGTIGAAAKVILSSGSIGSFLGGIWCRFIDEPYNPLVRELLGALWTLNSEEAKAILKFGSFPGAFDIPTGSEKSDIDQVRNFLRINSDWICKLSEKNLAISYFLYSYIFSSSPSESIECLSDLAAQEDNVKIKTFILCTAGCVAARHKKMSEIVSLIVDNRDHRFAILESISVGSTQSKSAFLKNLKVLLPQLQKHLSEEECQEFLPKTEFGRYVMRTLIGNLFGQSASEEPEDWRGTIEAFYK